MGGAHAQSCRRTGTPSLPARSYSSHASTELGFQKGIILGHAPGQARVSHARSTLTPRPRRPHRYLDHQLTLQRPCATRKTVAFDVADPSGQVAYKMVANPI